jgi:hypothetical protein
MSTSNEPEIHRWRLVTIGRGSFASVHVLSGRPIAFKVVLTPERADELHHEYNCLQQIYELCSQDSFFAIPRPLAHYDPNVPTSFSSISRPPPFTGRRRPARPVVERSDYETLGFTIASYAMDQVLPIPPVIALCVRQFYPPDSDEAPHPSLCRLYFGKEI